MNLGGRFLASLVVISVLCVIPPNKDFTTECDAMKYEKKKIRVLLHYHEIITLSTVRNYSDIQRKLYDKIELSFLHDKKKWVQLRPT